MPLLLLERNDGVSCRFGCSVQYVGKIENVREEGAGYRISQDFADGELYVSIRYLHAHSYLHLAITYTETNGGRRQRSEVSPVQRATFPKMSSQ